MKSKASFAGVVLLLTGTLGAVAGAPQPPLAVSPGATLAAVPIDSRCPTFSWGAISGARELELAVFRLSDEPQDAEPVLRQRLPGSASSWTPGLDDCLESGERYAWSVRAIGKRAGGEWSDLRLFEIAAEPTPAELARALRVLESHLALDGAERRPSRRAVEPAAAGSAAHTRTPAASPRPGASGLRATVPDIVGIRSEVPDVAPGDTGGRFGVVGVSGESGTQDHDKSIGVMGISHAASGIGVQADGDIGLDGYSAGTVAARILGVDTAQGLWVDSEVCCDGRSALNYSAIIWNLADGPSDDPDVLALGVSKTSPGSNTNFIGFFDFASAGGPPELIGEIEADGSGDVHFTGSAASVLGSSADFAEYLPRRDPTEALAAGDVVGVHSGAVSLQTAGADQILVVTTRPLVLGRRPPVEALDRYVAVALLGQVPVRVAGPVRAGDYLVASGANDGKAVGVPSSELDGRHLATLVGRALVGAGDEDGSADALVGLFDSKLVGDLVRNELEARAP